jgi:Fungalysin metallopeptidase (M36)/Fungalysin/Thermolysin Propeptide Motif/Viral BACON domain
MCRSHRLIVVLTLIYTCVSASLFAADADNQAVINKLKAVVPRLTVTMDEKLGVARHIASPDSFLTGPSGIGKAVAKKALVGPHQAVRGFLNAWPSLFGGDATLLDDAVIIRDDVTERSGLHTVVWQQMLEGIPVHGGAITAHTTKRDELISIGSGFVPSPDRTAKAIAQRAAIITAPVHTAADATAAILSQNGATAGVIQVTQDLGGPKQAKILTSTEAKGDIRAELVWFPVTAGDLRLAWYINLSKKLNGIMYDTVVDATSLDILNQVRLTSYGFLGPKNQLAAKDAAPAQVPQPVKGQDKNKALAPGRAVAPDGNYVGTNITRQNVSKAATALSMRIYPGDSPDTVGHELVSPTIDTTASPNGWIDENKETNGNNVDAHLDLDDDNRVDGADLPRPKGTGTSTVTFDFPIDLTKAPSTYRDAAIVNLFYWCNFTHDRLYHYGFTESAGNFQLDNLKRGGYGDDALQADAQDGSGTENANMATPTDGRAPRMQMFIFTRPIPFVPGSRFNPYRDSSLVAEVIVHEYVHGLTHRLIGGGVSGNMDSIQSDGMGEGWSDFYALSLLNENDDPIAAYPVGLYLASDQINGIRTQPYAIEPRPSVIKTGTNPPKSKNTMTFNDVLADTEVHATGTVWCQILWECRGEMITKYGAAIGNELMLQLVTDGLKLTPNKPSFTDARDAIIRADSVANAGANTAELWRAFSKRGLGRSAMAGDSGNYDGIAESFENSDLFRVSNAAGFHSVGRRGAGGTFTPQGTTFILENPGITNVTWSVSKKANWFTLSPTSGTLAAGAKVNVRCSLNTAAYTKPLGTWHDTITFTDSTNNITVTRPVSVRLIPVYTVSSDVKVGNWIDNTGHTALNFFDDYGERNLDDGVSVLQTIPFSFAFYDENTTGIYVNSNGFIGFSNPKYTIFYSYRNVDLPTAVNKEYFYSEPTNMAAVMWQNLRLRDASKVTIGTTGTTPNRKTVVTWTAVPLFFVAESPFTFQVVLEENTGDIVMNYKDVQEADKVYGQGRKATVGIEEVSGQFADKFSFMAAKLQNNLGIRFSRTEVPTADNAAPTMATDPHVSVELNAARTKCSLTMLAADDGGEANLIYTWSESGSPTSLFNFSTNGNNAAKTTEVTFTHSGTFVITGTATDEHGLSVSRTVSVAVPTLLSSLVIAPDTVSIPNGESTDFDVSGFDQFGDLIPGQPTLVSWSETGPGTIDPNGRYTASYTTDGQGRFDIEAVKGTLSGKATVTVTNGIPRVIEPAAATPVTGTTTTLSVTGVDDVKPLDLIYTWSTVSTVGTVPAAVTFDNTNRTNGGNNCVATFTKAGTYNLRVTITDGQDGSVESDVTVIVTQIKNRSLLAIDPRTITMEENTTQTFVARDSDQFGDPMTSSAARTVVWSTTLGSINAAGLFKAPSGNVNATVLATESGGLTATAAVTIFVPSSNNGRFGGKPTSDGNSCGIGALSAMLFLFLLIAFNFNRRRFN